MSDWDANAETNYNDDGDDAHGRDETGESVGW